MDKLLVTRPDTLVGAAVAQALVGRMDLVGAEHREVFANPRANDSGNLSDALAESRPTLVVHTGRFSMAGWDVGGLGIPADGHLAAEKSEVELAGRLSDACRGAGAKLVVVVTDGMFAGPHMFHNENARPNAAGVFARNAAAVERKLLGTGALVVRSHVYGWSPAPYGVNYAERMFHELTGEMPCPVDAVRHATPILATDLAERLFEAYRANLAGLLHITGAERTSPYRFAAELAAALSVPGRFVQLTAAPERGSRVNLEETSLNTTACRRALKRPLPMLREGLARFAEQAFNGYRTRVGASASSMTLPEMQAA
ncbi:MAG: sugar nucleotide-binding protein [Planctomycetales bacterium]|nr:sugar nucleotide-binding protein [Planctomycetales bacterium]